jgi:hypothetical protein
MVRPWESYSCQEKATHAIYGWQFGDKVKGEASIIETITYYCPECMESAMEAIRKAIGEARAS